MICLKTYAKRKYYKERRIFMEENKEQVIEEVNIQELRDYSEEEAK